MLKKLIVIVLTAFTAGLIAETAVAVLQAVHGVFPELHDAIELGVSWFVVVAVFYIATLKAVYDRW